MKLGPNDSTMIANNIEVLSSMDKSALASEMSSSHMVGEERSFQSHSNSMGMMSMDANSLTTFFRARATPLKYQRVPLPPILKIEDFSEFIDRHKACYVDKSLFIKEVLDSKQRIMVYTKPRGMGKSLNMSMLHTFLNRQLNKYKVAEMFEKLKIKKECANIV